MHHLALARLASLLEQEVWAVTDVPLHCQRTVDAIFHRAGQQSNRLPVHTDDGHTGKPIGIISTSRAPPVSTALTNGSAAVSHQGSGSLASG